MTWWLLQFTLKVTKSSCFVISGHCVFFFSFKLGWQSSVPNMQDHLWGENRHSASWENGVPRHPSLPAWLLWLQDHPHRLRHSCRHPGQDCVTSLNPPCRLCALIHCLSSKSLPFLQQLLYPLKFDRQLFLQQGEVLGLCKSMWKQHIPQ